MTARLVSVPIRGVAAEQENASCFYLLRAGWTLEGRPGKVSPGLQFLSMPTALCPQAVAECPLGSWLMGFTHRQAAEVWDEPDGIWYQSLG